MLGLQISGMQPALSDLLKAHKLEPDVMSFLTGLEPQTIQDILLYRPVERDEAQKVLDTLSLLLERKCTFEELYIPLREQEAQQQKGETGE